MCLTHLCSLYIQPKHLDCLAKMRGFKTAKHARHQAFTLSMCFLYWFGLLVLQPFLLLFSFFILCCFWLSFLDWTPSSSFSAQGIPGFWSLFWCLATLDVCDFRHLPQVFLCLCDNSSALLVFFMLYLSLEFLPILGGSAFLCFGVGSFVFLFSVFVMWSFTEMFRRFERSARFKSEMLKTLQTLQCSNRND